jgi:hypothetical protein
MLYRGRRMRELPTSREQEVLDVIDVIAARWSIYRGRDCGGSRDVDYKAVQVYLAKRSLGWGMCRIGRRFGGVSLQHAMRLYPRGKQLIEAAVAKGEITPKMITRMMPPKVFM